MTHVATQPADPTDVIGRRIGAWTIDLALFLALTIAVLGATGWFSLETRSYATAAEARAACDAFADNAEQRICDHSGVDAVFIEVKGSTDWVWFGYTAAYILVQGLAAASPGKLLLGLRVVGPDGIPIGIGKSLVRTILWVADAITCGIPIVGGVAMTTTTGHQRVGDKVASTYVVRKESVGQPVGTMASAAKAAALQQWQPASWGAAPVGWAPPATGADAPTPTPVPTDASAPGTDGPIWDDARNTYIQWDAPRERWVQWNEAGQEWVPIQS